MCQGEGVCLRGFQSLFFWMMPTGQFTLSPILRRTSRFNPCSSGWCLPAHEMWQRQDSVPCFNPCSSGWCLPAMTANAAFQIRAVFQSLFFWMMPTGYVTRKVCLSLLVVSILVLLDDAYRLDRKGRQGLCDWDVSILVLLDDAYRLIFNFIKV